ncbi:MAG: glycosyltransferase family 4 protein [Bacteroidota bacterium]|nr:glycosyltransferase family 4 protein [Bacteroidota bacterium]
MKKILYITHIKATFIDKDTEILAKKYQLIPFQFHAKSNFEILILLLKQMLFLIFNISKCDIVFSQFAGYHSFLPAIFAKFTSKPFLVMVGGTDAFSFPSINYGNFRKKVLGWFSSKTYRFSTVILPVHESLIDSVWNYYNIDYKRQGIKYFAKRVNARFETIYNGYDSKTFFKNENIVRAYKTFVTIGKSLENKTVFLRKGIDLILQIAPKFPECTFIIIGMNDKNKMPPAPANVVYHEYIENNKLKDVLSEAAFYLQLSIAEGFPNALCEAMLCECVPIVSDVAAMPMIVGESGFILLKKDKDMLAELIRSALESDYLTLGKLARKRIEENYSLDKRAERMFLVIDSL